MANSTRFLIEIPDVGADADTWGNILNAYFNSLEPLVFDKRGDTVNGNLSVTGSTSVTTLAASGALTVTGLATLNGGLSTTNVSYTGSLTGGTGVINIGSGQLVKDTAGNAGLGVTPSAWGAGLRAFQIGSRSAILSISDATEFRDNSYSDGGANRYLTSDFASTYRQVGGAHIWLTAPSGTAGDPISFRQDMTLTQGGNLLVGTTVERSGIRQVLRKDEANSIGGALVLENRAVNPGRAGSILFAAGRDVANPSYVAGIWAQADFPGTGNSADLVFGARVNGESDPLGVTERARITSAGNLRPGADNAYTLGEPSFRWSVVYARTGTINTSDVRAKLDFAPTFGLDFINALEPVSYRYKNGKTVIDQVEDGVEEVPAVLDEQGNEVTPATTKPKFKSVERVVEGTRRHHGLKAQQVKSVLDTLGVDFAGWVMDDPSDPESSQGLRYDQFIAPLIRAVQELSAQNAALESRLAALEAK